jgi:hypothetical protein
VVFWCDRSGALASAEITKPVETSVSINAITFFMCLSPFFTKKTGRALTVISWREPDLFLRHRRDLSGYKHLLFHSLFLVDNAALHHKHDAPHSGDVLYWVAVECNDVSLKARRDRADLISQAERFGAQRIG